MTDMNNSPQDYYTQAKDWQYEKYESQKVWLNRCFLGLGFLSLFLILSLSANLFLLPLKQTVPFLYTLNETTGELTQLGNFKTDQFKENWLMTRFLLVRYVVNRESYDADNLEQPYQITWAMSDNLLSKRYENEVRTTNEQSPFAIYGKDKYVTVHVLSVNQLNVKTASIRFIQTIHHRNDNARETLQKEAIVKWRYARLSATEQMLDRDPLGFKVTYYQPTQLNVDAQ